MAEFCKQCHDEFFPPPANGYDFAGLTTKAEEGFFAVVLCENCGYIQVYPDGSCLSIFCHNKGECYSLPDGNCINPFCKLHVLSSPEESFSFLHDLIKENDRLTKEIITYKELLVQQSGEKGK